ncbi:LuxR C-terminal-related transcriptional regulator, partial [Paracoccus versutus]|uniref:response regulator transcription factor n=1 Tax=Paracoccus versutus TaxID=34007 RepID=UPI001FB6DAC1
ATPSFPDILPRPAAGLPPPVPDELGLTQRQQDVLRLVADGQSNKRIALSLGLSVHTVKLHLRNASLRLGAHNRTEAAMRYRALRS